MQIEELVLTANSKNTFEPIASSLKYTKDIVWYDFNDTKVDSNNTRNGFIKRRYDPEKNNDAPQDWRTMLWARYLPDPDKYYKNDKLTDYSVWTSGNAVMGVIYKADNALWMAKNTNVPSSATDTNVFYYVYTDITMPFLIDEKLKVSDGLEIKSDLNNVQELLTFGTGCENNFIRCCGTIYHNNVFIKSSGSNSLGINCYKNTFGVSCTLNNLQNACYGNIFMRNCSYNTFNAITENNILVHYANWNVCGSSLKNNFLGWFISYNSIGNECQGNYFIANVAECTLCNDIINNIFKSHSHVYFKQLQNRNVAFLSQDGGITQYKTIERNDKGKYLAWWYNSNNTVTTLDIP